MTNERPGLPAPQGNIIRRTAKQAQLLWRLFLDKRVSPLLKLIPAAGVLYLFFPLDFVPDLLVGLGQIDDVGIVIGSVWLFMELCPPEVVQEHWRSLTSVVPGVWREVDGKDASEAPAPTVVEIDNPEKKNG